MEMTDQTMLKFYQLIGEIMFGAANADKKILPEEINEVHEITKSTWLDLDYTFDQFGTDTAYQIEIVFDYLLENGQSRDKLFEDIKAFKEVHPSLFNPQMIEVIMESAYKIVSAYARTNKSEIVFLSQLRNILKD